MKGVNAKNWNKLQLSNSGDSRARSTGGSEIWDRLFYLASCNSLERDGQEFALPCLGYEVDYILWVQAFITNS